MPDASCSACFKSAFTPSAPTTRIRVRHPWLAIGSSILALGARVEDGCASQGDSFSAAISDSKALMEPFNSAFITRNLSMFFCRDAVSLRPVAISFVALSRSAFAVESSSDLLSMSC